MTINVKPEHESLISEKLRNGEYHSPDEVVGAALSLLQEHKGNGQPAPSRLETLKRTRFTPQTRAERIARSLADDGPNLGSFFSRLPRLYPKVGVGVGA